MPGAPNAPCINGAIRECMSVGTLTALYILYCTSTSTTYLSSQGTGRASPWPPLSVGVAAPYTMQGWILTVSRIWLRPRVVADD